jgi:adenylate cyclase
MPPTEQRIERRLAAIFAADVEGYSRLMNRDEIGTLRALTDCRALMDSLIARHRGRIANTAGDSVLAEFPSAVDAVRCAMEVQKAITQANEAQPDDPCMRFRIGVHVGDVMIRGGDLFGDGVNIATRLQALAQPGGICISGDVHRHVSKALSLSFADLGPQMVKNIPDPIKVLSLDPREEAASEPEKSSAAPSGPLAVPDRPSIAVLPFTNMSSDPEQEYVADGIVEEIIAALSRVRSFFVVARNSTFTYKGRAVDLRQVSRELGVRYVLEGSLRKSGRRIRVTAQLIDGTDGSHIWADRYDGEIEDIFDVQDRMTEAIVGAIQPSIRASEIERARRKRPDSLDAYDCVMRAMPIAWSNDSEAAAQGLALLERAMALDPAYALAKSLASWCYAQRVVYFRSADPARDRARALELAEAAAELDSDDPLVLTTLSAAYTLVRRLDLASVLIEKALLLDPNSAWAWHRSGWLNVFLGKSEVAIQHFQRSLRLSPLDSTKFNSLFGIGAAHFEAGRYEEAAEWTERGLREQPSALWAHRNLAAAYAKIGCPEQARQSVEVLHRAFPDLTVSKLLDVVPASPDYLRRLAEGLRSAGLP